MPRSGRHLACSTPAGIAVAPFGMGTLVARRHLTGHRARRYHRSAVRRPASASLVYHLPDILTLESAARVTLGYERTERSIGGVQNHLASFRMWVPLQIVPVDSHTAVSLLQS